MYTRTPLSLLTYARRDYLLQYVYYCTILFLFFYLPTAKSHRQIRAGRRKKHHCCCVFLTVYLVRASIINSKENNHKRTRKDDKTRNYLTTRGYRYVAGKDNILSSLFGVLLLSFYMRCLESGISKHFLNNLVFKTLLILLLFLSLYLNKRRENLN